MTAPLLEIRDLEVAFPVRGARGEWLPVVRGASLAVGRGEMVGLVGESGSGKSMTALAALGLVPPPGRVTAGSITLHGPGGDLDLLQAGERALRMVRGGRVAMVFQEPATAFNPVYSIGFQVAEAVRAHRPVSRRQAYDEAARLLDRVALADARRRLGDYPHQLSGGQRQRAMIAMALAGRPELLLADEPTGQLDSQTGRGIMALLQRLVRTEALTALVATHDQMLIELADQVVELRDGQVVEDDLPAA